jgi:spermidine/putrescine transport system permease protein
VARLAVPERSRGGLLVAPTMLWLLVFLVVPLGLIVLMSFGRRGPGGEVLPLFTLDNYRALLQPTYARILGDSLWIAALTTAACLGLGYPLALFVARSPASRRPLLLLLILVPFWTNFLIRIYAWRIILQSQGVLAALLPWLGPARPAGEALFELLRLYTPGAVLLGMVYEFLPFMVLPIFSSLEKQGPDLLEAAGDLGARPWQAFRRVTWPLSLPGVVAGSVLTFVPAMGMYVVADLLGGAQTLLVGNLIRNQFLADQNPPLGSAAALVLMVLTLVLTLAYTRRYGFGDELRR